MAVGTAIQIGVAVSQHQAQNNASKQNKEQANKAAQADLDALSTRMDQERTASTSNILDIERQVAQAQGLIAVQAGEAGVAGASVQALLAIVETRGGEATGQINANFRDTRDQLRREQDAVRVTRQSRINAVPRASAVATGAKVAGAGLDLYTSYRGSRPPPTGGG